MAFGGFCSFFSDFSLRGRRGSVFKGLGFKVGNFQFPRNKECRLTD